MWDVGGTCTSNIPHRTSNIGSYLRRMSSSLSREQLLGLASQFGTPLYVYHAEKIKEQYDTLAGAFSSIRARFFYACKALTNINILKYINSLGAGLDCVSIHEVN